MTEMIDTTNAPLTPEPNEAIMKICKCGCNEEISALNNWEYKRGHKPKGAKKSKAERKPRTAPVVVEEVEEEVPHIEIELNDDQLTAIWGMFSLNQKAFAIAYGLTADRE
jgi:hypothetical protein